MSDVDRGAPSRTVRFAKRYAVAAVGSAFALTAGVMKGRHRQLIRQIAAHFGHSGELPRRLPSVAADEITSARTPITLAELFPAVGNVTLAELVVLARLARESEPSSIFEIGTFDGRTTLALAMNAPDANVFTLDLPPTEQTKMNIEPGERVFVDKPMSGARFQGTPESARITQLYGDSATFDFKPYAAQLVFVDGSHAYDYVLSDADRALSLVGNGPGVLVFHDYGEWDGVTRALEHLARTDRRFAGLKWVEGTTLAVLHVVGR